MLGLVALAAAPWVDAQPGTPGASDAGKQGARYLQSLAPEATGAGTAPESADAAGRSLARAVAQRFGVKVLRAQREELDGKTVYRMVVMRPGGNFDDAYAVDTLILDAATGALVPQFRNKVSGYQLSSPPDRTPRDNAVATTIRRESFRRPDPSL
jgi:hypothetical protein